MRRRVGGRGALTLTGPAEHGGVLGGAPPFLMSLDVATGKPRWRRESERLGRGTALVSGDHVLVPCPHYAAVALPAGSRR